MELHDWNDSDGQHLSGDVEITVEDGHVAFTPFIPFKWEGCMDPILQTIRSETGLVEGDYTGHININKERHSWDATITGIKKHG